jgi:hypothetical protein
LETVLIVLGFLAFIAWRERQHRLDLAVVSRRSGGRAPALVASSQRRGRRKPGKPRVISADDDKAFNEARGLEPADEDHGGVAEELEAEADEEGGED